MDRFIKLSIKKISLLVLCGVILQYTGCAMGLATALWVINGNDTPAEFDGLKEKRVAVVCHSPASLSYQTRFAANELASRVSRILKENVSKIEMVPASKVADWMDENQWTDAAEIGLEVEADYVVEIDLQQFKLQDSTTLYRGRANLMIRVVDVHKDEAIWEKQTDQIIYPINGGVPISDKQLFEFKREFVNVVATQVSNSFIPHDATQKYASDNLAFK